MTNQLTTQDKAELWNGLKRTLTTEENKLINTKTLLRVLDQWESLRLQIKQAAGTLSQEVN